MIARRTLLAALLASTAAPALTGCAAGAAVPAPVAAAGADDARLMAFLDEAFMAQAALSPETLTQMGLKQGHDRLDDYTDAAADRALALAERQVAEMRADFSGADLSPSARLSYRLFEQQVEQQRRLARWRRHRFTVSTNGSPMGQIPVLLINAHRVDTVEDARAYVARLVEVERVMDEVATEMAENAAAGIVAPAFVFAPVAADGRAVMAGAPFAAGEDTPVWADFKRKVAALDADEAVKAELLRDGEAALTGPFRRGYQRLLAEVERIGATASSTDGAWRLPDGAAFYADALRFFTTTDLTADQIHDVGLAEVARIQGEMEAIKAQVGFDGSLQAFFAHVKSGPEFKYPNTAEGREQYLADARAFIAQVMADAPRWFHRLPRTSLEVRAVEEWRQETASVAFYNRPSADGSRPGIYYVNLADMTQVLKPQIEAISYHEGAPGHHFQLARAQEQEGLPMFRRLGFQGAYIEGWGLYAEKLGKEMGYYRDPYSDFGRLSLELWRAVRLVVDTGLHHKRWSREQAIAYFQQNSLLSERDIVKETERYIVNPGQATSYKIGQLKILELRDRARRALGDRFDIRDFHEVVLSEGALPLDLLEAQVEAWVAG